MGRHKAETVMKRRSWAVPCKAEHKHCLVVSAESMSVSMLVLAQSQCKISLLSLWGPLSNRFVEVERCEEEVLK